MIVVENIHVDNLVRAIYSTRNAMNSWNKSDSDLDNNILGERDLNLAQSLIKAGTDHSKFMRMINVTLDIVAPLYFLKEFDTYKIGTVSNSCSTMHKIHDKEFTLDDFSHEHLCNNELKILQSVVECLNINRTAFISKDDRQINQQSIMSDECYKKYKKKIWWQMIQLLPSSYNQRRTVQMNYQVLRNIYFSRKNHKLDEWHDFCDMIEKLPYGKELICIQ